MRELVLVAGCILFLGALAGCIGGEDAEPEDVEPSNATNATAPSGPNFAAPGVVGPSEWWTAEPTIEAAEDGTLYMVAPGLTGAKPNAAEGAAWLWKSSDGGDSWSVLRSPRFPAEGPPYPFHSGDADVATSPDGWVYYVDLWESNAHVEDQEVAARNVLAEASNDGGETWTKAPVTIPHGLAESESIDRPWLVTGEDGFVGLFYAYFPDLSAADRTLRNAPPRIEAVFSNDHGRTWGSPVSVVADGDPSTFAYISKPMNLGNGTLAMAYGHVAPDNGSQVRLAVSSDRGSAWEDQALANVPGGFDNLWPVQAAADDAGNLHVAWAARTNETMSVYHASTSDLGETVEGPTPIRSAGLNFVPWIDARGDGQVAVGWYGSNATGDPLEAPNGTQWYAYVAEREGSNATFTPTKVSDGPVKVGPMCPGGACSEEFELLDFVGLTYDADGQLHYGFAQSYTADEEQAMAAIVHHAAEKTAG